MQILEASGITCTWSTLELTDENINPMLWWSWGQEWLQRKWRIFCLLRFVSAALSGMVWSRHGSSLVVHGYRIWLQIIKLESLGFVFVKLIFHPSLHIPSWLYAAATAGKARFRITAAPSTWLFPLIWGEEMGLIRVRGRMQWARALVIVWSQLDREIWDTKL